MAIMLRMIDKQAYLDTYAQAVGELSDLVDARTQLDEQRERIDQRLAEVRKGVIALAPLCGKLPWVEHPEWFPDVESADVGFTSAIRRVLQKNLKEFLSPVSVRDGLKGVGYEIKSKNILPSVHNTLKRLYKAGNLETDDIEGKTCYRWKGPIPEEDRFATTLINFTRTLDALTSGKGLNPPPANSFQGRLMRGPAKSITPEVPTIENTPPKRYRVAPREDKKN